MLLEAILTRNDSDQRLIDHFDLCLEPRIHQLKEPDNLLLRTTLL